MKNFKADYYYKKVGASGRGARTQLSGSKDGVLKGANTESAFMNYLRSKHQGCEIELMKLEWK